jgi:hypothetical protein
MTDERTETTEGGNEPMPDRLVAMARDTYNPPPATPRDEIWARIEATRRGPPTQVIPFPAPSSRRSTRWLRYATGVAALIAIGIGIGRFASPASPGSDVAISAPVDRSTNSRAYAIATSDHLGRVETLLTSLRTEPENTDLAGQARDLLISTRLLLDARRLTDPRTRALLEDLELILVQVVQLDPGASSEELDLITDGLEQRQVLPRLRNAIPAGPSRL